KRALHVRALVVVLQEFLPLELEVPEHPTPERPRLARHAVHLERDVGLPPSAATSSRLSRDRYALSAGTSLTVKFLAVVSTSGLNCGLSAASGPSMTTAVTTFVLVPVIACAFTQVRPERSTPYFSSYHRTKRDVEKPVESGANVVSTERSGRAERSTSPTR